MLVAFWSPFHGTGNSANMMAVSGFISEKTKKNILITHTHFNMNNLEKPLLGDIDPGSFFEETGLEALIRHFKSGNIDGEQVRNCTIDISENLHLMAGVRMTSRDSYENEMMKSLIVNVLKKIEQYYDYVMVDVNSGYGGVTKEILKEADIKVITLRQNRDMISLLSENITSDTAGSLYLFGNYDEYSKLSIRNLRHAFRYMKKENTLGLRYCTSFSDAISDERVWKFIKNGVKNDDESPDRGFFEDLQEISETLGKMSLLKKETIADRKMTRNMYPYPKGDLEREITQYGRDYDEQWHYVSVSEEKRQEYEYRKDI